MDVDAGAYLSAVEGRFVALRRRGYMLSARDVARVEAWHARGVPLAVALRVLEDGVRAFRRERRVAGGPRGLGYFEPAIREAMRARSARLVGTSGLVEPGGPPSDEADEASGGEGDRQARLYARLLAALEGAGRTARDGPVRDALRRAWVRAREAAAAGDDIWALTAELDGEILRAVTAVVPSAARDAVADEARRAVAAAGSSRMGAEARAELEGFERDARLRAYASVPELLEVLLDPTV